MTDETLRTCTELLDTPEDQGGPDVLTCTALLLQRMTELESAIGDGDPAAIEEGSGVETFLLERLAPPPGAALTEDDGKDFREVLLSIQEYRGGFFAPAALNAIWNALAHLSQKHWKRTGASPPSGADPRSLAVPVLEKWLGPVADYITAILIPVYVTRDGAEELVNPAGGPLRPEVGGGTVDDDEVEDGKPATTTTRTPRWIAEQFQRFRDTALIPFLEEVSQSVSADAVRLVGTVAAAPQNKQSVVHKALQVAFAGLSASLTGAQYDPNGRTAPGGLSLLGLLEEQREEKVAQMLSRGMKPRGLQPIPDFQYGDVGVAYEDKELEEAAVKRVLQSTMKLAPILMQQTGDTSSALEVTSSSVGWFLVRHWERLSSWRGSWAAPMSRLAATRAIDDVEQESDLSVQARMQRRMFLTQTRHQAVHDNLLISDDDEDDELETGHDADAEDAPLTRTVLEKTAEQWPMLGLFGLAFWMLTIERSPSLPSLDGIPSLAILHALMPYVTQPLRSSSLRTKAAVLVTLLHLRGTLPNGAVVFDKSESDLASMAADQHLDGGNGKEHTAAVDDEDGENEKDALVAAAQREQELELELAKLRSGCTRAEDLMVSYVSSGFNAHFLVLQEVVNVCAVCPSHQHRAAAVAILNKLLQLYENPIRCRMLVSLLKLAPYPSVASALLLTLKEEIATEYVGIARGAVDRGNGVVHLPTRDFVSVRTLVWLRSCSKSWLHTATTLRQQTYFEPLIAAVNCLRFILGQDIRLAQEQQKKEGALFTILSSAETEGRRPKIARCAAGHNVESAGAHNELNAFIKDIVEALREQSKGPAPKDSSSAEPKNIVPVELSPMLLYSLESTVDGFMGLVSSPTSE